MQILNIFHVLVAIALVAFVLIQKGQGATAGASFGAGASATVFGSRGAGTFLTRATWVLAALFCAISLTMAVVVSRTVGVPDTDLGVVADSQVEEEGTEEGDVPPPGAEMSASDAEQSAGDLPVLGPADEAASDVPEFEGPASEAPEGADAVDGTEVRDESEADNGEPEQSSADEEDGSGR